MADSAEEIHKSVKAFKKVLLALMILTVVTVLLSGVEMPTHGMNILVGMIVATIKASLVGLIFMHLAHERSTIYKVLVFTGVLALAIFLLTYWTHGNPLVNPKFDSQSAEMMDHLKH